MKADNHEKIINCKKSDLLIRNPLIITKNITEAHVTEYNKYLSKD
jgi:hypothetical protein